VTRWDKAMAQKAAADNIGHDEDDRQRWLAAPNDLHYRGQLAEIGVRATDAMEQEMSAASRRRV
jgi:hypothetical protein